MKIFLNSLIGLILALMLAPSVGLAQNTYWYNGAPVSILNGRPVTFQNNQPLIVPGGATFCNVGTGMEAKYDSSNGTFNDTGNVCPGFDRNFENSVIQQRINGANFSGTGTGVGNVPFGGVNPTGQSVLGGTGNFGSFMCGFGAPQSLQCLIWLALDLVRRLIPVVMSLALLFFFWGVARFILAARSGNEEEIKSGKQLMFWGIIALFVMVSIWGIVAFFASDLGIPLIIPLLPNQLQVTGIR